MLGSGGAIWKLPSVGSKGSSELGKENCKVCESVGRDTGCRCGKVSKEIREVVRGVGLQLQPGQGHRTAY